MFVQGTIKMASVFSTWRPDLRKIKTTDCVSNSWFCNLHRSKYLQNIVLAYHSGMTVSNKLSPNPCRHPLTWFWQEQISNTISSSYMCHYYWYSKSCQVQYHKLHSGLSYWAGRMGEIRLKVGCKLDSALCAGVCVRVGVLSYFRPVFLDGLNDQRPAGFWVPSHRLNFITGERKGITQTIILTPSRPTHSLVSSAKLRSANLSVFTSLVWRGWGSNPGLPHPERTL